MCVREGEAFNTSFWIMVSLESEDQYYHYYPWKAELSHSHATRIFFNDVVGRESGCIDSDFGYLLTNYVILRMLLDVFGTQFPHI